MPLHLLPTRTAGAAENMALDFLLLQRYPETSPRFRHYEWPRPAFTFGYSQKVGFVRDAIEGPGPNGMLTSGGSNLPYDLCRRPTGGGIVDHREDWTYALIVPRGHALEADRASESYRKVHLCLVEALRAQGVDAQLQPALAAGAEAQGVCFQRAEVNDVVHAPTGAKIAGAAQKRNKRGLLLQGSIWRPAAGAAVNWETFEEEFTARLAARLDTVGRHTPWPELNEDEVGGLTEKYASPEWMEQR